MTATYDVNIFVLCTWFIQFVMCSSYTQRNNIITRVLNQTYYLLTEVHSSSFAVNESYETVLASCK